MTSCLRWAAVGLALVGLTGCSPSVVTVKGKVLKGGAPMVVSKDTYVTLLFNPEGVDPNAPGVRSHSATFDQQTGTYRVELPPGKYKIALTVALPPKKAGDPLAPLPPYKPDKVYELTKNQDLDIEVPGK
jgi:hypothetical protein